MKLKIIDEYGNSVITTDKSPSCVYDGEGYPACHCNDCIDEILELNGIKKNKIYFNKTINQNVRVVSFCPLPNCMDIFWRAIDADGKQYDQCQISDLGEAHNH